MVIKTETCWERSEAGAGAGRQKVICGQDSEKRHSNCMLVSLCVYCSRDLSALLCNVNVRCVGNFVQIKKSYFHERKL